MFWLTLRQYIQEIGSSDDEDEKSTGAAALQPFTVAVTTTSPGQNMESLTSLPQDQPEEGESKIY